MKKDVIYIDVEDDITAVIDKLKNSKEKIIALVPPKGSTVFQSTVNLKLLKRAATSSKKQSVIVSNNNALLALAGGLGLYVAKNLQSKPYIPTKDELTEPEDDSVEVTDAVNELAGPAALGVAAAAVARDEDELQINGEDLATDLDNDGELPDDSKEPKEGKTGKKKKEKKVPNFNSFKKKMLIAGGITAVVLFALLFIFGRSKASIVIRAETTPVGIAYEANITDSGTSDPASYTFRAEVQEESKTVTQSFTATGEKDLGSKAAGSMTLSIACSDVGDGPTQVPAGTGVSAQGLTFITQQTVSLTTPNFDDGCSFVGSSTVKAQKNGDQYNLGPTAYTVNGYSSVTGTGGQMSGGVSKVVKVVSQADVDKAKAELAKKDNADVKAELEKGFGDGVKVLSDSFTATIGQTTSEPAVGQEANEGKLTAQATYTMLGIKEADLKAANEAFITTKMDNKDQQQVYDDGVEDAQFEKVKVNGKTAVYKVSATGQYGPKFDIEQLKQEVSGKKIGEIRSYVQSLPGVKSADINLTPFWARKAPGVNKIEIELKVDENVAG